VIIAVSKPVIEYLIHFDNKVELCDNEESFKNLLRLNGKLTVEATRIIYEDIVVDYKVKLSKAEKERFFELKIFYKKEDTDTYFTSCLNLVTELNRAIYFPGKVRIYTLWNDLSFDYSKQAYPLIYEVENLMRKLITKFMLINVGAKWSTTDLTDGIRKQAKSGISSTDEVDILYRLDFKDLSDVLLRSDRPKSSQKDINKLYQQIMEAKTSGDLNIDELKNIVPQSNWQKYFSTLIQYDAAELDKSWSGLYELRCKVAHNNFLDKGDYQEIIRLTEELKVKLQDAIEKLDEVEVPEEDKEDIIENVNDDIVNQIIESELNDLNSNRQAIVNNNSRIGIPRRAGLDLDSLRQFAIGAGQARNQMANIARGMGMAASGQNPMKNITRGMGMAAPGQNFSIRKARAKVNDEAIRKGTSEGNDESENLTDVQDIKDEETSETTIQTEDNLIYETENIEEESLNNES